MGKILNLQMWKHLKSSLKNASDVESVDVRTE